MTHFTDPRLHDPELDRLLNRARTPQVPEDLAARIVRNSTELPQDKAAQSSPSAEYAGVKNRRPWRGMAGFAAIVLLIGGGLAIIPKQGEVVEQPGQKLVTAGPSLPRSAPNAAPVTNADVALREAPRFGNGIPAPARPSSVEAPSTASDDQADDPVEVEPSSVELADDQSSPLAPVIDDQSEELAQQGPADPQPAGAPYFPGQPVYGPTQGLGVTGTGILPTAGASERPASRGNLGGPSKPRH